MLTYRLFNLWLAVLVILPSTSLAAPFRFFDEGNSPLEMSRRMERIDPLFHRMAAGWDALQNDPRFLITPYYGNELLYSWFDHTLPTYYTGDDTLLTFQGYERPNPDPSDCTGGWDGNCYDGHNGYDFDMDYEPVLASAGGWVRFVGWDPSCVCWISVASVGRPKLPSCSHIIRTPPFLRCP